MKLSSVNSNYNVIPIKFKGNKENKTGGAGKAWSSAFIPGLGQFFDGRNAEGFGYLGASAGLLIAQRKLIEPLIGVQQKYLKNMFSSNSSQNEVGDIFKNVTDFKKSPTGKVYGAISVGLLGLWIANVVDAYKGNKNKK